MSIDSRLVRRSLPGLRIIALFVAVHGCALSSADPPGTATDAPLLIRIQGSFAVAPSHVRRDVKIAWLLSESLEEKGLT